MNERLISYIQNETGECALVKVGAMIVGKIKVRYSFLSRIVLEKIVAKSDDCSPLSRRTRERSRTF